MDERRLIDEAIKHFKTLQKRYTTQHNGKQCEFVRIAIDALREKKYRTWIFNYPDSILDGEKMGKEEEK